MFYTILWVIVWLLQGSTTFTFGTGGEFWALIIALVADIFFFSPFGRKYLVRV